MTLYSKLCCGTAELSHTLCLLRSWTPTLATFWVSQIGGYSAIFSIFILQTNEGQFQLLVSVGIRIYDEMVAHEDEDEEFRLNFISKRTVKKYASAILYWVKKRYFHLCTHKTVCIEIQIDFSNKIVLHSRWVCDLRQVWCTNLLNLIDKNLIHRI